MTPESFVYVAMVIVALFWAGMCACDAYERRALRRKPRQSGEYPHSHVDVKGQ